MGKLILFGVVLGFLAGGMLGSATFGGIGGIAGSAIGLITGGGLGHLFAKAVEEPEPQA
jgi:hypothetical protein